MDWILLIVPGTIWGASFLFIAEGLEAMGPNGVTFTRILVGFLTLSMFPGSRRSIDRSDWIGTALVGVLWMAFPLSMFPYAERHVSSALTGMLNGAVPLFIAIVAAGMARRWPSHDIALGLAVGLLGAVLMGLPALSQGRSTVIGVLLILAALVSYGFALNIARPVQQRQGARQITGNAPCRCWIGRAMLSAKPYDTSAARMRRTPITVLRPWLRVGSPISTAPTRPTARPSAMSWDGHRRAIPAATIAMKSGTAPFSIPVNAEETCRSA